jgi:hypothetical protein
MWQLEQRVWLLCAQARWMRLQQWQRWRRRTLLCVKSHLVGAGMRHLVQCQRNKARVLPLVYHQQRLRASDPRLRRYKQQWRLHSTTPLSLKRNSRP